MKSRLKKIGWLLPLALPIAYALALADFRSELRGMVEANSMQGHEIHDALEFKNGSVTIKTCCGDQNWGTYQKGDNGHWMWTYPLKPKLNLLDHIEVRPGVFTMTFSGATNPYFNRTVRRLLLPAWRI